MSQTQNGGLLAIDVGTSRVKVGWFPDTVACDSEKPSQLPIAAPRLPEPAETFAFPHQMADLELAGILAGWLAQFVDKPRAVIASVHPVAAMVVEKVLVANKFEPPRHLDISALPIKLGVVEPTKVGIDRVLAAVAVNRIRSADRPAIVISLGSACAVNLISADGTFQGGAILPGLTMSANALNAGTASLPLLTVENFEIPDNGIGKDTNEAMSAGIYWGVVGAIEKLIHEQSRAVDIEPQLFLTGGDAPRVIDALQEGGHRMRLVSHLVLAGIAIACEERP